MNNNIVIEIPSIKKEVLCAAAYCRVSTAYEEQQTSLDSQIQYYTDYINNHKGWFLAGIYSEQASGTRFDKRTAFNRMMKDCRAGKIDYIITKSISRFGRNTLPFLQSFNELIALGITIYFETIGRCQVQKESIDKGYFIKQLKEYSKIMGYTIYGFALMDNHYHLIIQTMDKRLQEAMHRINNKYSKYFNNKYNRVGHVFQGKYKAVPVQDERYILKLLRYIL